MNLRILTSILCLRWKILLNYAKHKKQTQSGSVNSPIILIFIGVFLLMQSCFLFYIILSISNDASKLQLTATIVFFFLSFFLILYHIFSGQFTQAFYRNSGDTEFLLCQPITAKELVAAKIAEYTGSDLISIFLLLPFFTVLSWITTGTLIGFISALLATVLVVLSINTFLLVIDQTLRRFLNPEKLRNAIIIMTFVSGLLFIALLWSVSALDKTNYTHNYFISGGAVDVLLDYSPFGWLIKVFITLGNTQFRLFGFYFSCVVLTVGLFIYLAFIFIGYIGKTGWTMVDSPYGSINRNGESVYSSKKTHIKGFVKKDLLMYRRDPKLLFNALGIPILVISFNLATNRHLSNNVSGEPANMALFIYGCLAYVSTFCCARAMDAERKSVWIFYILPKSPTSILWSKVKIWSAILVTSGIISFAGTAAWFKWPFLSSTGNGILLATGLFLVCVMGVGLSASGSDPGSKRYTTLSTSAAFTLLFFAISFLMIFLLKELWAQLVGVFLFGCLTFACWQAGTWRIRYILDPGHKRSDHMTIGEGLATVAIFFFIQNIFAFTTMKFLSQIDLTNRIAAGYAVSGIMTSIIALWYSQKYFHHNIRILGNMKKAMMSDCMQGIGWGLFSGMLAIVYLLALKQMDLHGIVQEKTAYQFPIGHAGLQWPLVLIILLIAPIAEEIIFRGVLFQSLNNFFTSKIIAVIAGALLFAIVHPLGSVIPVFILGIITCELYKNTKYLAPSILSHIIHNATCLAAAFYLL